MHRLAVKEIVESVRRRAAQGDRPTEPAQSVEVLEETILELAKERPTQETPAARKCDCEGPQKIGPGYHAPYCSTVPGGKELREQLERDSLNR